MFAGINGLLIPGGAVSIHSSPYAEASNFLFDLAKGSFKTKSEEKQNTIFFSQFPTGGG